MAEPTAAANGRDWIGYRIAWWRALADLSQRELAERVGVTRQYIQMIEAGRRPVATRLRVAQIAAALGVSYSDLTAQPIKPRNADEMVLYALAPAVRHALDGEDDPPQQQRTVRELAVDVDRALALRMAADWDALAELLPTLITETGYAAGDDARRLHVRALANASWTLQSSGYLDLARLCADRAVSVAGALGEPVHIGAAAYTLGQAAFAAGSLRYAQSVTERAAEALQGSGTSDPEAPGMAGMLHLVSALSSASLGQSDRCADHIREAGDLADQTTQDPFRLEFGRPNVGLWEIAGRCEAEDWGTVPELAAAVDPTRLRTTDRQSRLHVDAARGYYEIDQPEQAVTEMLTAMEISPRHTRVLPCVRELTSQLARDVGPRGGSAELARLVSWVGVDPLAEV
jgi:transcriptional regulator with XRE-family HTH domain